MIRFFIGVLLLCKASAQSFDCEAPRSQVDLRTNHSRWSLLQYNVEWLFTEPCSSCPGICTWDSPIDQKIHLDTIQNILKTINADTVHLAEVQSCTQLEQVKPSEEYNSYLIKGKDTYTQQNVGMLTKIDPITPLYRTEERFPYPIDNSRCGYNSTPGNASVSKHLYTDFVINTIPIRLIGAHLLSNPNDPTACAKREAQAQVLQQLISVSIENKKEVILIGDLNDYDNLIPDMNNDVPNSMVIDILKGNQGKYNHFSLYSVADKIKQNSRYTEWYDANEDCNDDKNEYSMIDHMLVSKHLYDSIVDVDIAHLYPEGCNTYQSDHYPLLVTFSL